VPIFLADGVFVGDVSGFIDLLELVDGREAMPGLGRSLAIGEYDWPGTGRLFSNVAMRLVTESAVVLAMVVFCIVVSLKLSGTEVGTFNVYQTKIVDR